MSESATEGLRALEQMIEGLVPDRRKAIETMAASKLRQRWVPLPGPQDEAYECKADELFFGGSAGGGKTEILLGLALQEHKYSLVLRRVNKEVRGLERRLTEILKTKDGYNSQTGEWKLPEGRVIQLGGCQYEDDKFGYQGVPHDGKFFDEIASFSESQFRFIIGWNRSVDPNQRCRVVAAGNPPITAEGLWVVKYWAPWLDPQHPNPAKPGELRWFTTLDGADKEVDGPQEVWDGKRYVKPRSRTFIPAELEDNPFLEETGYGAVLGAMPGILRRAMRDGDFTVGIHDDEWQVIPTAWIKAAQDRWKPDGHKGLMMTAIGVDVAQGPNTGGDKSVLAPRYGSWYAPLQRKPGSDTPDTPSMVGFIISHVRSGAGLVIDIGGGYGVGPAIFLKENGSSVKQFDGSKPSTQRAAGSQLQFFNLRAEAWWRFREALDPGQDGGSPIALPPDQTLLADLTAPRYKVGARGIQLEAKEDLKPRLGRSPDDGDAVVLAWSQGQALAIRKHNNRFGPGQRPVVNLGYSAMKKRRR